MEVFCDESFSNASAAFFAVDVRPRPVGHRAIHTMRAPFARLSDAELRAAASESEDLPRWIALAATAAFRILGQDMYDVQLRGALALARGAIAGMQTGEGKTLAAVPAISWFARGHCGVHVMTVNDLSRASGRCMDGRHLPPPWSLGCARSARDDARGATGRLRRRH